MFPIHVIRGISNVGIYHENWHYWTEFVWTFWGCEIWAHQNSFQRWCKAVLFTNAWRITFPLTSKVEAELNRLEKEGIVANAERPMDCCAKILTMVEKNGNVRICVDLQNVVWSCEKGTHHAAQSWWYVSQNSWIVTVFKTRCLWWILPTSVALWQLRIDNIYNVHAYILLYTSTIRNTIRSRNILHKMRELLQRIAGVEVNIDYIFIHGKTCKARDDRLHTELQIIHESGLKWNREKCEIGKSEIEYFGHNIASKGIQADVIR